VLCGFDEGSLYNRMKRIKKEKEDERKRKKEEEEGEAKKEERERMIEKGRLKGGYQEGNPVWSMMERKRRR
jgi:hypothetical protein